MGISTWKAEYYYMNPRAVSVELELYHATLKWHGLRKKNRHKHKIHVADSLSLIRSSDGHVLVDTSSCCLCYRYMHLDGCPNCPLSQTIGGTCDDVPLDPKWTKYKDDPHGLTPWTAWTEYTDPEPMIEILEKTYLRVHGKQFEQVPPY
jgi:hypothetical protein